ncbi:hypothetical protein [Streptomyces tauricus]|nr:hypothetical protein [Streptomyces tauricus]
MPDMIGNSGSPSPAGVIRSLFGQEKLPLQMARIPLPGAAPPMHPITC